MKTKKLDLIFLGPPGAGKGTIAKNIVERFCVPHISTGDILREAVNSGTYLGKKVKSIMESGALVPDDVMIEIVKERLTKDDCWNGFILDGFPRTVFQADSLENILTKHGREIEMAIYFDAKEQEIVKRITARRVCPKCGRIYNLHTLKPLKENICDEDGAELIQREDDYEDTVRKRFGLYLENTAPLIEYYKKQKKLVTVDGSKGIDILTQIVFNTLEGA